MSEGIGYKYEYLQQQLADAVLLAVTTHQHHRRKYTFEPYAFHLFEAAQMLKKYVTDIEMLFIGQSILILHDIVEDCQYPEFLLKQQFCPDIHAGVMAMSDLEDGNRETRTRLSRERLAKQGWLIQTCKICDRLSNLPSIIKHAPTRALNYVQETRLLLDSLLCADPRARNDLRELIEEYEASL